MKSLVIFSFLIGVLCLTSCSKDTCESTIGYVRYDPVYKSNEELSEEIRFVAKRELKNPGKIYYYQNYLLISDRQEGVHVIDNRDPNNPQSLGFIEIAGNVDIAFSGNYIYADTYLNILVIDIENIEEPKVVGAINDVKNQGWGIDNGLLIVDFVETDVTETFDCSDNRGEPFFFDNNENALFLNSSVRGNADVSTPIFISQDQAFSGGAEQGQGGSLARMALFGGYFYYVNEYSMNIYDVSDLSAPKKVSEAHMEWGVETIFPYKNNLFIGANNGMHIYDNEDPTNPQYLSTFAHANACDPVVVQDDIAYVTLRDGNECEDFVNQLDVVDVSNLLEPQLIASFPMHNPHGLAVRGDILYLCEGDEGLKVFNVSEVEEIHENQIGHVKEYDAFDVISVSSRLLLMIGSDGFYQFDTNEPSNPSLLSNIKVN
ncbi:MAG: hypothetical protein ACI9FN_002320 [Saprospiraceae bacterium]|jgi:hypothetical protein